MTKMKQNKFKIKKTAYETELSRLQLELLKLQEWIRHSQSRVVIIFEGRDAAGKGGLGFIYS